MLHKSPMICFENFFFTIFKNVLLCCSTYEKKNLKTGIMFSLIHVENLAIENGTITMHSKCVICPDNFQDRKLFAFRLFKYSP